MAMELTVWVLDGESPGTWPPFGKDQPSFDQLIKQLDADGKTVHSDSRGFDVHDIRFSPTYVRRSTWNTELKGLDSITGFIVEGENVVSDHARVQFKELLTFIAGNWAANDDAMCRRLGYVFVWFLTADKAIQPQLNELKADVRQIIKAHIDVTVLAQILDGAEKLHYAIPTYLETVGPEARLRGLLYNGSQRRSL